jgi:hypothetical protein
MSTGSSRDHLVVVPDWSAAVQSRLTNRHRHPDLNADSPARPIRAHGPPVRRKCEIADLVRGLELPTQQIAASLDMFRPGHDKISKAHIGPGLFAFPSLQLPDTNQPASGSDRDGRRSTHRFQLFQNCAHVVFHCVLTDVKDLPYFLIALAESHLLENLKFALGQFGLRHRVHQFRSEIMRY